MHAATTLFFSDTFFPLPLCAADSDSDPRSRISSEIAFASNDRVADLELLVGLGEGLV